MCLIVMLPIIYYAKLTAYVAVIWARDNAIVNWLCARNDLELADGNSPAHEDVDFIDEKDRLSSKGKKFEDQRSKVTPWLASKVTAGQVTSKHASEAKKVCLCLYEMRKELVRIPSAMLNFMWVKWWPIVGVVYKSNMKVHVVGNFPADSSITS